MKKRVLSIILCLAMVIASCSNTWAISSAKAKPVRLNASKKSLKVGKKYQLKVKKAKGVTIKKKTFTKKGAAVSVSKKGKVTAKKSGKATVKCKVKYKIKGKKKIYQKTLKCKFTVSAGKGTETPVPGEASAPADSQETQEPSVEQSSAPTGVMSSEPNASAGPDASQTPEDSSAPAGSSMPGSSNVPENSTVPSSSNAPENTIVPENSAIPENTVVPENSTAPENSATPENTNSPIDTKEPESTETPAATVAPTETPTVQQTAEPAKTPAPSYPSVEFDNSFELIKDMGLGINLGNTMESVAPWIEEWNPNPSASDYETAWGQPKTTPAMIQGMRAAGFKTLRLPVAWSNMMRDDGTYTINEAYFKRVDEIMGYALDAGMYVIVNIHYDGGWWARFGSKDETERQEAMKKYKAMWTQLTEHYKDYSNMLIFESANEELGERLNATYDYENSGYYTKTSDLYDLVNEINQTFVNIVRESGGNNADRYLLIAGYDTDIDKTCNSSFKIPTDEVEDHLMVSVHYYTPSTYCIADDPNNSWGYKDSWGTEADVKEMQSYLSKLKTRFTDEGIPVIIGEYGVTMKNTGERKEGEDLFFKNVCEYSLDNGICPVLWDTGNVYNKSTAAMSVSQEAADYLELSAKAASMDAFVPGGVHNQ